MESTSQTTKLESLSRKLVGLTMTVAVACLGSVGAMAIELGTVDVNQHGLTGSWYQPTKNGQGIELEIYPNAVAPGVAFLQGSWFTFEWFTAGDYIFGVPADRWPTASGAGPYWAACGFWDGCVSIGGPRWYTFSGSAPTGPSTSTLTLYQNVGGKFNALPATSGEAVGTVVLNFGSCASATMEYKFSDGTSRHGSIPLVRLTPNVTCSESGENLTNADFSYSGNWFNPTTSGQGFVFELNPHAQVVFFTWYTYASDNDYVGTGAQRVYTGQANYSPGARALPVTLFETLGGLFDSVEPPAVTLGGRCCDGDIFQL